MIPRPLEVYSEQAYARDVLFAVELLDAVTLQRVPANADPAKKRPKGEPTVNRSGGVRVIAEGLTGKPIVNKSGFLVWLQEDFEQLQKLVIDPGLMPYESAEVAKANVKQPLTSIELAPRPEYAFPPGMTGLLGSLIEQRVGNPLNRQPIIDAEVWLEWLDDLGNLQTAPTKSHTNKNGDLVTFLRLAASDTPKLDENGGLTVRLQVQRDTEQRHSADFQLPGGHIADPSTFPHGEDALIFAWDELQP